MEIMGIYGMAGWPGTPGEGRLRAAEEEIQRDSLRDESRLDDEDAVLGPAELDARKLLEMMDIMELTGESQEELEELHRSGTIPDHLDVAQLALGGPSAPSWPPSSRRSRRRTASPTGSPSSSGTPTGPGSTTSSPPSMDRRSISSPPATGRSPSS